MRQDAESHAEEDQKQRETIDLKNRADHTVYETEKLLSEHKDVVEEADRTRLQAAIDQLNSAKDKEDAAAMTKSIEEVDALSQEIGKKIYEKGQASGAGDPPGGGDSGASAASEDKKEDETIIDADYEVKE